MRIGPLSGYEAKAERAGADPSHCPGPGHGRRSHGRLHVAESLERTLDTGEAWFFSRSRRELWHKGETSGNVIKVHEVQVDCDTDTILLKGSPTGPACHTGKPTCFFQGLDGADLEFEAAGPAVVDELFSVIESRKKAAPEGSYVAKLLHEGIDRIGKKVIEEAGETVIAAKNGNADETVHEVADLWFHSLVLLSSAGLKPRISGGSFQSADGRCVSLPALGALGGKGLYGSLDPVAEAGFGARHPRTF